MEAIDDKIILALQDLPHGSKEKILGYIQKLKSQSVEGPLQGHPKLTSKPGYGGAKDLLKYIPDDLDKISVSEDFEEYLTTGNLVSTIQNLPQELQTELWQHLEKLKAKAEKAVGDKKPPKKFVPKPGFGGGKGFFVLKEGWDDPLTEEFKDYM